MAAQLTLTNVARLQYGQFFLASAGVLYNPDGFFTKVLQQPSPKDGFADWFAARFAIGFAVLGMIFVATAQLKSVAAQRKVMQYSLGGYVLVGVTTFIYNKNDGVIAYAWSALNLILLVASVYGLHREEKLTLTSSERDSAPLKLSLRLAYIIMFSLHVIGNFNVADVNSRVYKSPNGMTANLKYTRLVSSFGVILGGALVGAAQLANEDMKKMVQYLMAAPILQVWGFVSTVDFHTKEAVNFLYLQVFFLVFFMYACYPASCAKMTIRLLYTCKFIAAFFALTKTKQWITLRMPWLATGTDVSEPMGKVLGLQMASLGLLYVAAAQCDDAFHKKFLRYALVGYCVIFAGEYYYLRAIDQSVLLMIATVFGAVYHNELGLDKVIGKLKTIASSRAEAASATHSSPRSENRYSKRSSTPSGTKKSGKKNK